MLSNKLRGVPAAFKNTFIASDGKLRAVWRLMLAMLAWYALYALAAMGVSRLMFSLFESWGVTSANLYLTPAWVQYLVSYQAQLFHVAAALPAALAGWLLARPLRRRRPGVSAGYTAAAAVMGFFGSITAAMLLSMVFRRADSMRATSAQAVFSVDVLIMLAVYLIAALAEGQLALGYIRETVLERGGRTLSYIAAAVMFCAMTGFASGVLGVVNTLLLALTLCRIAEKAGVWAAVGVRAGWLWAVNSLAGFPGGGVSVQTLYPVSENLLTGGDAGIMSGLAVTLVCGAILWFTLGRQALLSLKQRILKSSGETEKRA